MYLSLCLKTLFHFKNRQMFLAHPVYWWANDIQLNILRLVSFSSCPPTKRRRGKCVLEMVDFEQFAIHSGTH